MASLIPYFAVGLLLIFHSSASPAKIKIIKPDICDKSHTWLHHGKTYTYSFTALSESAFIGASESKTGFKYTCNFRVNVPRKCEGILEVIHCDLYERLPGVESKYEKSGNSEAFNNRMTEHSLYFQYNLGEVIREGIVTSELEDTVILNVKRAILSSFQLKIMPLYLYDEESHHQTDIFGDCPISYSISESDPDLFYTERNLRLCQMPQIYRKPRNIFSLIQKVYGGYKIGNVSESYYPFLSNVRCEHKVNGKHQLKGVTCLQQQIFQPSAYNGSIYASYMTNISQSLELSKVKRLETRSVNRRIKGKKYVDILFEFEEQSPSKVTMETIESIIHKMVESMRNDRMDDVSGLYHQLVLAMKKADQKILSDTMTDIWHCHGNNTVNCDTIHQFAETDYFLDGLLSCGSSACLEVFGDCLKNNRVYDPFTSSLILYDLAFNHEISVEVISAVFDLCKGSNHMACWLPLGTMVGNFLQATDNTEFQKDHAVSQIVAHLTHEIGFNCKPELWDLFDVDEKINKHDRLILMFKVVGNIGKVIQRFSSLNSQVSTLVKSTLICVENSDLPYHLSKSAVQAIATLEMTADVKSTMLTVLYDINREASVRAQVFTSLADTTDEDQLTTLLKMMHTEALDYMKRYMTSYVQGVLENDQPDRKSYRDLWRKIIKKDRRRLPYEYSFLYGKSHYIDMSRYFKLPLTDTFQGLQLEMNVVYDPVYPSYQSVVFKLNFYYGEKYNILELGSDIHDLQQLLSTSLGSSNSFYNLVSVFMKFKKEMERSDPLKPGEMFGNFHPHLVQEIRDLFQRVNYQSNKEQFGGLLHWKLFGREVAYADVHSFMEFLSADLMKNGNEFLENLLFHFNKGYHRIKTRSSKIMDLTKVLPTVSGASLNMTVLVTHTAATEVNAKLTLKKFLLGIGPVDVQSKVDHKWAFEFLGQMTVDLPGLVTKKARMVTDGMMRGKADIEAKYLAGKPGKEILRHHILTLFSKDDGAQMKLASVKIKLVLIHGKDVEEIPFLPDYHKKFEHCYDWSLLTEQVCVIAEYPNVTTSTTHAFFPLSGPFSAAIIRKNSTFKDLKFIAEYKKKKDSEDVDIVVEDEKGRQVFNLNVTNFNWASFSTSFVTQNQDLKFQLINKDIRNRVNGKRQDKKDWGIRVMSKGQLLYGFMAKDYYSYVNKTSTKNRSLEISAPGCRVEFIYDKIRYNYYSHWYWKLQRKLFCTKAWPTMYPLHLNTDHASQNGDTSDVFIDWESKKSYGDCTKKNYTVHLGYPGQNIEIEYDIGKYKSLTSVVADVLYLGENQKQNKLMIKAEIETPDKSKNKGYQGNILLEHKDAYRVNVSGYVNYFSQDIGADFDVSYELLSTNGPPKSQNLESKTNKNRKDLQKMGRDMECNIFGKRNVRMWANLTTAVTPVKLLQGPAANIDYKLTVVYPSCNDYKYFISKGMVGRLFSNKWNNFRYSFNSSVVYGSHKDFDVSEDSIDASVAANFNVFSKRKYFDACEFSTALTVVNFAQPAWLFNTSYSLKAQHLEKKIKLTYKAHQNTPWAFLNYQTDNTLNVYWWHLLDLQLDYSNSYWSFRNNITWYWNLNKEDRLTQNGSIESKVSFIPINVTFDMTGKYIDETIPDFHWKFLRGNITYAVDVQFASPPTHLMNITVTSEFQSNVSHLLTWESELTGSTQVTHTLAWPTDQASLPRQSRALVTTTYLVGQILTEASKTMMANLKKTFPEKEIPLLNITVNHFYKNHLKPFLLTIPLTRSLRNIIELKLKSTNETGSAFIQHMNVFFAKLLNIVGSSLQNPPAHLVGSSLKRKFTQILKEGKLILVQPLPLKFKKILWWEKTIGQKYFANIISSLRRGRKARSYRPYAAIENFRHITTFDSKSYEIPANHLECKHLLTADFQLGKFALVMSVSEITLFTLDNTVTVDHQGRLFIGDCDEPVEKLPYILKGMNISRPYKGKIEITTSQGINLAFYTNRLRSRCSVTLPSGFRNETLGLLGNRDAEKGTDWKTPEGVMMQKVGEFLQSYALSGPKYCHQAKEQDHIANPYRDSLRSELTVTPVDMVLAVPETLEVTEDLGSLLIELVQSIARRFADTRIGLLSTGSKTIKEPSQHFMDVKLINTTMIKEVWRTVNDSDAAVILPFAASYPFRTHSHKAILLLSPKLDILNSTSSENLKTLFKERKITFYMASEYKRFKNRVLGISWDKRAIMYQSDRFKMLSFPKGASMKILKESSGALFDIKAITQKDTSKMEALVKYVHEEMSTNNQCL
ncbi:uncharacterized protein LOC125660671 isoform X3 [Ostrea edulis]|uniref:uncharacterized protein LOC125660671 isoform X3 n=1 Tax=Ostrea edulis TaxID=37623 RepID=UPI0024AE889C|nr:uncharacterized protein LOC125660671 isoform X3 [Ostrea edulis]